jgi:hypothetical protein
METIENKKILVIGDIHGHTQWSDIYESENADLTVFLGDYVDTFRDVNSKAYNYISPKEQLENLKKILSLPQENNICILGNHDLGYVDMKYRCSGWTTDKAALFSETYKSAFNEGRIIPTFTIGKFLFSHAGVSKTWMKNHAMIYEGDTIRMASIEELNKVNIKEYDFNMDGGYSRTGDSIGNSPLWIRPSSLAMDAVDEYVQIVGHTPVKWAVSNIDNKIYVNDALHCGQYIVIENGEVLIRKNSKFIS